MFLIFSLLLATFVTANDAYDSTSRFITYDDLLEFLRTKKYNKEASEKAFEEAREYVNTSALYRDYFNPPAPFERLKMDQVKHLEDAVANKNYQYDYEFQLDMIRAFHDFHDAHQVYLPPYSSFEGIEYILPAAPQAYYQNGVTHYELVIPSTNIYNEYREAVDSGYIIGYSDQDFQAFIGKEISKINDKDPSEYIIDLAMDMYWSKDPGASANHVLNNSFFKGYISMYGLPKDQAMVYTFTDGTTMNVPYLYGKFYEDEEFSLTTNMDFNFDGSDRIETVSGVYLIKEVYSSTLETGEKTTFNLYFGENNEIIGVLYLGTMANTVGDDDDDDIKIMMTNTLVGVLKTCSAFLSRLIIDVRGNGGGESLFGDYFTSWLNWDNAEPHATYLRARADDDAMKMLEKTEYSGRIVSDPIDKSDLYYLYQLQDPRVTENRTYTYIDGKEKTYPYTPIYTIENVDVYLGNGEYHDILSKTDVSYFYEEIFDFDRVDVTIVTDGGCGSSCAAFLWDAYDTRAARIVSVGGIKTSTKEYLPSGCAFPSGDVLYRDISNGGRVGFMTDEAFRKKDTNLTQEFSYLPSDFHIEHYKDITMSYGEDFITIFPELIKLLDNHEAYPEAEKMKDIKRNPDMPCNDLPNSGIYVYGRRWDETTHDYTGDCAFLYCGAGYYENYDRTDDQIICSKIPSIVDRYEEEYLDMEKKYNNANTATIVLGVFFGAVCCVLIVILILFFRKRSSWKKVDAYPST